MSLTIKIVTQEEPSELTPWNRVLTEEIINISPEDAYKYIETEVIDAPEKKYDSLSSYWNECWNGFEKSIDNVNLVQSTMNYYNQIYDFWYGEKTNEAFKTWLKELKSPLFTIQYENVCIEVFNNDVSKKDVLNG